MATGHNRSFIPVELEKLQAGMLVDRSLHVHLPANDRYVMLAKALHPLEQATLDKIKRYGGAFAAEPEITSRFPTLELTAQAIRDACDNGELAPFEKNLAARNASEWVVDALFGKHCDPTPPLFVFHKAFGVPRPETLLHVSDLSVEACERGIKLAAVAGLIALWLGYSDTQFLIQFAETVFCAEARVAGSAPGIVAPDRRFLKPGPADELPESIELARWLLDNPPGALAPNLRIVKKLRRQFRVEALMDPKERERLARKAAA